jgi:DNA-binding response OmpR family regulator
MVEIAEGWRVLVAEEDNLFADAVDAFLRHAGFRVVVAVDGEAALQEATDSRFDALLTDLRMPRLDGAALIRRVRADRPDMPIIVISGNAPEDWEDSLQRAGEGPLILLNKPARLQDVVRTLNDLLGEPGGAAAAIS